MLLEICALVAQSQGADFSRVLELKGRTRRYFSHDSRDLFRPAAIADTRFHVETNLSANDIVKLSRKVLSLFSYSEHDLSIEVRE